MIHENAESHTPIPYTDNQAVPEKKINAKLIGRKLEESAISKVNFSLAKWVTKISENRLVFGT